MTPQRVLFAYRSDVDVAGGAATVMNETAAALRARGVEVDITHETTPDTDGYDLLQAFNIWDPGTALEQLRHLRASGLPVVWLPFYLHWTETAFVIPAVHEIFAAELPEHERAARLRAFAEGGLEVEGQLRFWPNEIVPGFHARLAEMLGCVDHVCAISHREMQTLFQTAGVTTKPYTLTPHGVDPTFRDATPDAFRASFGDGEFVLCVGAVDPRKNQLLLTEALRGTGLRLVLLGPSFEPDYLELCMSRGERVTYIDRLPRPLVASAYKAAAAHALPSFAEGAALANLEAAAAGRPLVVSNRSSEFEYFGDLPYYCDPADVASIREAVLLAVEEGHAQPERWQSLADRACSYTWDRAAGATLEAYRRTLDGDRRRVAAPFVTLAFAEELLAAPSLLAAYGRTFAGRDRATLVIYAPEAEPAKLARLEEVVENVGLAGTDSAELVALTALEDTADLAAGVQAVLSRQAPDGALAGAPRFDEANVAELRRLAERRWRLAA
jgi:glycosyltransferase involved in cell wall biosynthesis